MNLFKSINKLISKPISWIRKNILRESSEKGLIRELKNEFTERAENSNMHKSTIDRLTKDFSDMDSEKVRDTIDRIWGDYPITDEREFYHGYQ